MQIIQTLWSEKNENPLKKKFGWYAPEYHLMSWALSCLQIKKFYGKVHLYASSNVADLLLGVLNLPYDSISLTHDAIKMPNKYLWALPKIITYSLQKEPFLHIDGDVFLFRKLPQKLLQKELIVQNIEEATEYYTTTQKQLIREFDYFPKCVKRDFFGNKPIKAINAGILGANNIRFIKEYSALAIKYITKNEGKLSRIDVDKFNVFFEQHLFFSLAEEKNIPISVLFREITPDNQYKDLANFHEVPFKSKYLHLLGHFKRDEFICIKMSEALRRYYPSYYYKIIALYRSKRLHLSSELYRSKKLKSSKDFLALGKNALNEYLGRNNIKVEIRNSSIQHISLKNRNNNLLEFLKKVLIEAKKNMTTREVQLIKSDFLQFLEKISIVLKDSKRFNMEYLYGRDLDSTRWYANIFENKNNLKKNVIVKCVEGAIISSDYNWSGLVNKHKRIGISYYTNLQPTRGRFLNLLILEVHENGFSLYDLDKIEELILNLLNTPQSIEEILTKMRKYADEEIILLHSEKYNQLILENIKQLVLKKIIKPFQNIQCLALLLVLGAIF